MERKNTIFCVANPSPALRFLFPSMESSSVASSAMSPESTVTSLLSSSGHLRSSFMVPEHNTTFRYRDKVLFCLFCVLASLRSLTTAPLCT